ncbi:MULTISPECIES: SDR family NAD(P)-dependent oxidoreductase [unclassified Thalassospira]|uniref:SDR family NAD(P)-dependent oxidoreductase n=1 Tax=unclassified Thalassospira TaxID=2648997 RepID=UPI001B03C3AD|nr:SDR family NAD(P)-dependent oxidoreductase [Thalassospira sp.]MBO6772122.1 SDR family NAD(P)-dependent oxidoreductase [Thalassospira sp.]
MRVDGKRVFLTGATGGIGRPLSAVLRSRGAIVTTHDHAEQGDLMEQIDTVCKSLRENTPDILVNLAAINAFDLAEHQNYDALLTLDLLVPMRLCQAVLPAMRNRGHGQIVNIGSMAGLIAPAHLSGYVAAKAGLKGFSDALRREVARNGIEVCHIAPRATHTGMNSAKLGLLHRQTATSEDRPRDIAIRIANAIERNRIDLRTGWPERLLAQINALCPAIMDKILHSHTRTGLDILCSDQQNSRIADIADVANAGPAPSGTVTHKTTA